MNDFMLMEPTNQTFQELLSNGVKYLVPRFQRDYAWDQEQWEDLWADIETLDEEHYHYMGYIVLQRKKPYDFDVIDGQQRLVTLSLIILAAMKKIETLIEADNEVENNKERLKEITGRFIGSKDIVSLKVSSKLTLNRNNHRFYKDICSKLSPQNQRGLTKTNHSLKQAFEFFSHKEMGGTGSEIAKFVEGFSSRMIFTKIVVQDSLNAYKVFETLNARGVKLSTPDLLKNYIFSVITKNDDVIDEKLNELDEDWSSIITQLGENNFTDFVHCHHNLQEKMVPKKDLFKSIRQLHVQPESAYSYLNSLTEYASIYASLQNPYDEWWYRQEDDYREAIFYLDGLKLFNIKQPFAVLMLAFKNFTAKEFIKTLKYMYILSIRYNVICRYSPHEQEKNYHKIAIKIFQGEHKRASHIKNSEAFKISYPNDNVFKNAFEFHKIPSRRSAKQIRFLLSAIENNSDRELKYLDTVLEHVCPYHPEQNWIVDFGEGIYDISDRLGNMVLLEKDTLKRADFIEKKQAYLATPFRLAKKVAEYDSWNLQNLNRYQEWLAKEAVKTWRVD